MQLNIREETQADHRKVEAVVRAAFENAEHTSGDEVGLVHRLRKSKAFVPAFSLVAEIGKEIVGHIMLTRLEIVGDDGAVQESLSLAPVSVLPAYQRRGIGGKLIERVHAIAKQAGERSIVLVWHPTYYPRFGYQRASRWGLRATFTVPDEAFMAIELVPGGLNGARGVIRYPPEFGI